jgi:WD40 repeat protein
MLWGLAVAPVGDTLRVAFASKYGKVMVAELDQTATLVGHSYKPYDEWYLPFDCDVSSLDTGQVDGKTLLASGTGAGDLVLWDLRTGQKLAERTGAHHGAINELRFGTIDGSHVLCTAGADGFVRVWDITLSRRVGIDVGDAATALAWTTQGGLAVGTIRGLTLIDSIAAASPP